MSATDIPAVELIPANYFAPLVLAEVFARPAPLELDLGCGDGTFLAALAEKNPAHNFLGIERLLGRVRSACGRVARRNLLNVRVLRLESSYAVRYLLPPESVATMHLLFPDPWPKKRHQRRRIVTEEFLHTVAHALQPGGRFHFATDQADYFAALQAQVPADLFRMEEHPGDYPVTTFEKRFLAAGLPIYRLELVKVAPSRNGVASQ